MQRQPGYTGNTLPSGPVIVRLRLIGQMEAWTLTSESVLPTGRKTRALLAVIALSAPRPVLRGRVAEMLWSRRPEEQARASLRQEIHRLLAALDPLGGDVLAITRDHLTLRPGAVWVDVDEVLRATPSRPATLGLFDGDLLEDLDGVDPAFDNWLAGERERLRDRARALGETLLREQTEPDGIIAAAQQLLRIDRSHEQAWRALMRAYATRGDRGMAIQAYERCRVVLAEQLDAQPSAETQRLLGELKSNPAIRNGTEGRAESLSAEVAVIEALEMSPGTVMRLEQPRDFPVFQRSEPTRLEMRGDLGRGSTPPGRVGRGGGRGGGRSADEPDEPGVPIGLRTDPRAETRGDARAEPRTEIGRTESRSSSVRGGVRVGVLPLNLIGTTAQEAHLSTGLADDITAALARFRWMFLVSSSALARFSTQTRDEAALRRAFSLDVVLDGTVQRAGERLRVSLRLLDFRAGNQVLWSGRFDRRADDLLTLQDEISGEVAAQVDPEILLLESHRAAGRPQAEPAAYDLMLRALPLIPRLERPVFQQAGELLGRAIALEPDYAAAHAWFAYWHVFLLGQGWSEDEPGDVIEAGRLAERAVTLDPQDGKALTIAGHVRAALHRRLREALTLHERALALNPNLAMAWNLSGLTCSYLGDHDEAERRVARYKHLSPLDPQAFFFDATRIVVSLMRRRHEQAVAIGREVSEMNPAFSGSLKPYLSALGHLNDQREAAVIRARLLALEPGFNVGRFLAGTPFENIADRDHFAEGLRLAGIPA